MDAHSYELIQYMKARLRGQDAYILVLEKKIDQLRARVKKMLVEKKEGK